MFASFPDMMTVVQAAEALHIGRTAAYALVNNKVIATIRVGRTIRIPKQFLIDYVQTAQYNIN